MRRSGERTEQRRREGYQDERQVAIDGQATGDGSAIGTTTGDVFVEKDLPTNYHKKLVDACHKIAGMLGQMAQKDSFKRTVIAEHDVQDILEHS